MLSSLVYFFADLYPWWGLPLALIFGELANYYRRHGNRKKMFSNAVACGVFLVLTVLYFFYNGMERMRPAMQAIEQSYKSK